MKLTKIFARTLFLSVLCIAFLFVSCKDDDKGPEKVDTNPIVGSWQYVSVAPETPGANIPVLALIPTITCMKDLVFKFESNNTVSALNCDIAVSAMAAAGLTIGSQTKWEVVSNKLKLTNGALVSEFPITQTATQMTITVNTVTDTTKPAVNAVITLKKI
ncbi:hypothetical protein [Dyadobacter sp. CY312]|uniref:hypothetical protein n=1 Tax=Dyadobacter sp. CY312 TaxID=2907303 RepID=UPI001F3A6608|nr:hypothetical protein [Dyadobacter sp. CY312]MCE7042219.1 hypothetical protein [Dyadobacter sp. CY312]